MAWWGMTEVVTNAKEREWEYFLDSCNAASIYHTPEWKDFLVKTFDYESYYLFSKDENGNIEGLLPLFYVRSKLTGNRLCSVPFSHICGYIGSDNSRRNLIDRGINIYSSLNSDYMEIRDGTDSDFFYPQNSFSTHILELSPDIGKVWCRLEKKSSRWAVTKSKNMGVQVSSTKNIEDLKEFYEMNSITKKDIGVPCHSWKFFKNMFELLDKYVTLYIAKYNNEIIAGGIIENFKGNVLYGYGAAHPDYLKFHPYNAFIWKSIEDACANGYTYFDFGRTSYDNVGLMEFKKRWGATEKKLYYSYYPANPEKITDNRDNFKYKYGTKVIQNMPMLVYKKFSDSMFPHFG